VTGLSKCTGLSRPAGDDRGIPLGHLDSAVAQSHKCADLRVNTMQLETKFLRLRTPVTLGSRFGDWQVTWLGGWSRYRLYYLVMVVKLEPRRGTIGY